MSEKTHAEIIAEMRKTKYGDEECNVKWCLTPWADRLEAAHKREVATTKESLAVGNAAKLREAVIGLRDRISMFYKNEWIPYDEWEGANDDANSALAAPARNCDRFLTLDDAKHAYSEYLQVAGRRRMAGLDVEVLDEIDWCYAPAEGGNNANK